MKKFISILPLSFLLLSLATVKKTQAKRGSSWIQANLIVSAVNNVLGMVRDIMGNVYVLASAQGMIDVDGHTANPDSNGTTTFLPNQSINISWLASGVYFLHIQDHEGNRKSEKFLKE